MRTNANAEEKVARARADLVLNHPFFGHLALQMKLVEDRTCDTAWSDGRTLAYNPIYINMLPHERLKGLMGHVVMHPACRHHLRRNGRDPRQWNIACDYAINWILLEAGLTLPDGYLDDPALRGKTADDIYVRLFSDRSGGASDDQDHSSQENGASDEQETSLPDTDSQPGKQNRQHEDNERDVLSSNGAMNDPGGDRDEENEFHHGDPGRAGEVRDAPPPEDSSVGSGDQETDENEWRINLAQAADRARSMGDLPAGLFRMIESILSPKLDWRSLLSRFIQASARCDYAWMPPNRRYLHQGLYLPSMRSDDLPEVVVAIDTSGSISAAELAQFAAELSAILETCAMTVHLLYCDMQVVRAKTVHRQDLPLSLTPKGGGGTDLRPAFAWVEQQGLCPRCMIYLTDLACRHFPNEPPYPVLWAYVGNGGAMPPPFGETLSVK
jgi:predicted metal-dependent peptidase